MRLQTEIGSLSFDVVCTGLKPSGNTAFGTHKGIWEDNIKIEFKKVF
jgi:hypothetical protein